MLDLIKVKIRFGKSKIPLTMLVHDSSAMGLSDIKQYKRNYCVPDLAHVHIHRTLSSWNFPQCCGF